MFNKCAAESKRHFINFFIKIDATQYLPPEQLLFSILLSSNVWFNCNWHWLFQVLITKWYYDSLLVSIEIDSSEKWWSFVSTRVHFFGVGLKINSEFWTWLSRQSRWLWGSRRTRTFWSIRRYWDDGHWGLGWETAVKEWEEEGEG